MIKRAVFILFLLSTILSFTSVSAQSDDPIYVVQPGDSLSAIASAFKISVNDLMAANNITDPNLLVAGQSLVIPNIKGVTGTLNIQAVSLGDSMRRISRQDQVSITLLQKLNHIISPSELYVNAPLIVPQQNGVEKLNTSVGLVKGETLLEVAVRQNTDPWTLSTTNNLAGSWNALPGDVIYSNNDSSHQTASGLPPVFVSITIPSLPFKQGGTAEIIVKTIPGVNLSGLLVDHHLNFFPIENDTQIALQGTYALLAPGLYPLSLVAALPDGTKQYFEQLVVIQSGNYPTDPILSVAADTIDPTANDTEIKQLAQLTAPVTANRYWQGQFTNPSPDFPDCHPSYFGNLRNYISPSTNETYHSFHSGIDFCGQTGVPIVAAADGVVVFTGLLTIHGNTTIIDHGWGIYTVYCHQSQIDVNIGNQVKAGDLIGLVGETGRVTGPHLHWEVWVNGVQVDPLDWLNQTYP